jgi:hypothetical protein
MVPATGKRRPGRWMWHGQDDSFGRSQLTGTGTIIFMLVARGQSYPVL